MLLRITHETNLSYSDLINETVMELHMCPRQEQDQHRLSFELSIGPATTVSSYFDWLGNTVHAFTINSFHRELRIAATSVLETERTFGDPLKSNDPIPRDAGGDYTNYDYLQLTGPIVDSPQLRNLAESLQLGPHLPCGEAAGRMLAAIHERFIYEKGITTVASPITEVLEHGRGVCQDFTHLMIGLARVARIPARYASGFLHSGDADLRGATESHAWCELQFPTLGWIGFDPTNNCVAGENFVKLAVGRHYSDVPPHRGLFKGIAVETMEVTVKSEELRMIPAHLAAERVRSLPVQTYGGWREISPEGLRLVEEMHQQQQ